MLKLCLYPHPRDLPHLAAPEPDVCTKERQEKACHRRGVGVEYWV